MADIANIHVTLTCNILDGSDNVVNVDKAAYFSDLAVTEMMRGQMIIPHSTTEAIDFGSIASAKFAMVWIQSGSTVTAASIEVNDSDSNVFVINQDTSQDAVWCATGGAGITALEVTNGDGADTLSIGYLIAE